MALSKYCIGYRETKENLMVARKAGIMPEGFSVNHELETRFLDLWIYQSVALSWEFLITPKSIDVIPLPLHIINDIFSKNPANYAERGFDSYHNAYIRCIIKASEFEDYIMQNIEDEH